MTMIEIPEAFREFVENSSMQLKEGCERLKAAAEQAPDLIANSQTTWSTGILKLNLKASDAGRANSNSILDLLRELVSAKSYSESVELSAAYFRKQFDVVAGQTKDLAAQAQKVVRETTSMRNFAR